MQQIVFVLCEGPHDVAFLYRILKALGFTTYSEKIKNFPSPVNELISQSVQHIAIEEMKLDEIRQRPIPSEALVFRNETLFLLYSVHGDSKKSVRETIIKSLATLIPADIDAYNPVAGVKLAVLYFFDADNKGIMVRLHEIKAELTDFLGKSIGEEHFTQNACLHEINTIIFGAYVFAGEDETGKLEDIVLPLMRRDNEIIFDKAEKFLALQEKSRLKKLKIHEIDGELCEIRSNRHRMYFDLPKSQICIAGQLQNSGKSNVVIIKDCDYLTLDKIRSSPKCRQILRFFQEVI